MRVLATVAERRQVGPLEQWGWHIKCCSACIFLLGVLWQVLKDSSTESAQRNEHTLSFKCRAVAVVAVWLAVVEFLVSSIQSIIFYSALISDKVSHSFPQESGTD